MVTAPPPLAKRGDTFSLVAPAILSPVSRTLY
jgi:hypothetical protein